MKDFRLRCSRWFLPTCLALTLGWPHPLLAASANQPAVLAAAPTPTPTRQIGEAAADLETAERAVVQIIAVGAFVDPKKGAQAGGWGGSGFIIDPSGLAVTNNHVVTGAAFLKVYVPGEAKPRSAKVLGVDECADLAVIDIEGSNFPYLAWSDAAIKVGTPVYAAGYPLLDPEYTLTSGIIGKAQANGQTSWASLDYVLQHDATLNPGNSGGPLLDNNGQVVGINYRGYADANQYFAISSELARSVIEQLRSGVDLNSIGVNGEAITDGKTYAGVWVASVRSGSPADQTGIQPGDFIAEMEGVPVGVEATLESYCNILRGHDAQDVMAVTVVRGQGEVWEGQLNGRPLKPVGVPPTPTAPPAPQQPTPTPMPPLPAQASCYWIESKLTGYVLDIANANPAQGANLVVWPKNIPTTANQLWVVQKDGTLMNKLNHYVIDIPNNDPTQGRQMMLWPPNTPISSNQQWDLVDQGNGDITIRSRLQGYLLDVKGESLAQGTAVIDWPQKNPTTANQLWRLVAASAADCALDDTTTPPPNAAAVNPALAQAITAAGWNPANGQFQAASAEVITATFEKGGREVWQYSLASGATEYALYYKVSLGANGNQCRSDLGKVAPPAPYNYRILGFQLTRQGAEGRFSLFAWDGSGGNDGRWEDLIAQASHLIRIGKDQFNEVIITVQGKVITAYVNGTQLMQYTSTGFLEAGTLNFTTWAPQEPRCVYRDVQWFLPN